MKTGSQPNWGWDLVIHMPMPWKEGRKSFLWLSWLMMCTFILRFQNLRCGGIIWQLPFIMCFIPWLHWWSSLLTTLGTVKESVVPFLLHVGDYQELGKKVSCLSCPNPVLTLCFYCTQWTNFQDCLVVNGCDLAGVLQLCSSAVCFPWREKHVWAQWGEVVKVLGVRGWGLGIAAASGRTGH